MKEKFLSAARESAEVKLKSAEALAPQLEKAAIAITETFLKGGRLLACGNGGSAADAQHFTAEFVVRLKRNRKAYPAMALGSDMSAMTACGNDFGYERVFERQVEAYAVSGDVLVAISTSGNSPNILLAAEKAKSLGVTVISVTGEGGGKLAALSDILIDIKSKDTMRIQETYFNFLHTICDIVEERLAAQEK